MEDIFVVMRKKWEKCSLEKVNFFIFGNKILEDSE